MYREKYAEFTKTSEMTETAPEFATYEMRNPKPGKGLGYFEA